MKLLILILTCIGLAGCLGPKTPEEQVAKFIESTASKIDNSTPEGAFNSYVRLAEYAANFEKVASFTYNWAHKRASLTEYLSEELQPLDRDRPPLELVTYSGALLKTLVDGETQKRYEFQIKNITPIPDGMEESMERWDDERQLGVSGVITLSKADNGWTISSMSTLQPSSKGDFNELKELLPKNTARKTQPSGYNFATVRGVLQ